MVPGLIIVPGSWRLSPASAVAWLVLGVGVPALKSLLAFGVGVFFIGAVVLEVAGLFAIEAEPLLDTLFAGNVWVLGGV